MTHIQTPPKWRTLLILGRASNVPTVWSNCLAGWLIGGMAEYVVLLWLCVGGTLLHIGGMYLNDAFDVGFDRRFRQERPIPAGHIEEKTVWVLGAGAISGGFLCLVWGANVSLMIGLLLVASILLYDALHKHFPFSPVIMAACRFFLILAAFDSSGNPWQGFALWTAFAMAAYIVGLTYVARRESTGGAIAIWPCLFIAAPIGLSFLLNNGRFFWMGLMVSLVLLAWVVWCLQFILRSQNVQIFKTVSGLLAGIPLVDMISIVGVDPLWMGVMLTLFLAALFFQRFIPAT
ncbi:MAG: UbiA family prenyltransferase [Verrucomicrobia bacterium]|nr:UbiA family prenyltransferase [Verrucomicrobiota bacterium]MBT4276723.1 UbiA family prenyltransferase [Verrucomicrobiota bacterium]MBT5063190.1 UbiA family prenyltransferase [Verrucomicrobiota bacterium]MBT5480642.1 UbiA family prenyltransferase [Verrucomicrobiota bacterium]MBT6806277.1 UbiA family prenyltransferase [Verrucomicrobiota bacterium]